MFVGFRNFEINTNIVILLFHYITNDMILIFLLCIFLLYITTSQQSYHMKYVYHSLHLLYRYILTAYKQATQNMLWWSSRFGQAMRSIYLTENRREQNICIIISYLIPIHMCKSDSHHGQQAPMCICFYTTKYTKVDPSTGFCLHFRMFVNWFPADNVLLSLT